VRAVFRGPPVIAATARRAYAAARPETVRRERGSVRMVASPRRHQWAAAFALSSEGTAARAPAGARAAGDG